MRDASLYGEYICEAWNNLGRTEQNFILRMPEKPQDIPFIFPKSLGLTKVRLGVQYDMSKNYSVQIQFRDVVDEEENWRDQWIGNNGIMFHQSPK
jgi:hypothetical protein